MTHYQTIDGRTVTVEELNIVGMAGEAMAILKASDENGQAINVRDLIQRLDPIDREELIEWLDGLTEANNVSAHNFTI